MDSNNVSELGGHHAINELMRLVAEIRRGDVVGVTLVVTRCDLAVYGKCVLEPSPGYRKRSA